MQRTILSGLIYRQIRMGGMLNKHKTYPCSGEKTRPHPGPVPGERESFSRAFPRPLNSYCLRRGEIVLPLLGERAGVRASLISNRITTATATQSWISAVRM